MIQCQGCTCAGWLWEGEGGLGDHQPGVYVPLKALFLVEPVILYDKCIDDLGLYENYLICIFMNINKNGKK